MNSKFDIKHFLLGILQGALIGTGAILPGVSGGAMCAAFGVYEPLMAFLAHPIKNFKKSIMFLLPILIGVGIGFVLLAKAIGFLLSYEPLITMCAFVGLICGTVPGLAKDSVKKDKDKGWSGFIITLAAAFAVFTFLNGDITGGISPNFAWYIFCGAVWGISMVVPGLSSSSILLFIGLYEPMSEGIGNLDLMVLLPLGIGFGATLLLTARGMNYLFDKYNHVMTKIILGFVITSVLMIMPEIPPSLTWRFPVCIVCLAGGFALAVWMDYIKAKLEPRNDVLSENLE